MGRVRIEAVVAYALVWLTPTGAWGQQSDEDWLDDCRDDSDRGRLVSFCEVRVTAAPLGSGPIRIDPGANGGVTLVGWNENRVEVHARIQARARTNDEAAALAEEVTITSQGIIEADGPAGGRSRNWHVSFLVYAPAASDAELDVENGPMTVIGVTGRLRLDA